MAYDPSTQRVILFGGGTPTAFFNDTWAYDPAANTWTELSPSGTLPPPRRAFDGVRSGDRPADHVRRGGDSALLNDTWAFTP